MSSSNPDDPEAERSDAAPAEEPQPAGVDIHVPTVRALIKYDLLRLSQEDMPGLEQLHVWMQKEMFAEYPELERVHEIVANNYEEIRAEFAQELLDVGMRAINKEAEQRAAENRPS